MVIGKQAKSVAKEQALEYVAGYTIMNDVSARDLQLGKDGGIILGKNFDTSAPLGPCITLVDELPDPSNLGIRTWVNGELRQDGNTHNLIFDVAGDHRLPDPAAHAGARRHHRDRARRPASGSA